jgi:hypothetical protein
MSWANSIDPVKLIKSNPKKWVGSGYWVGYECQNEKSIKNIGF